MHSIKHVLFIMTDQMRADCMGSAGHPVVRTPHLDWLARCGVRFERAYVNSAVCGPSRACFYTGRYIHANRSIWNGVPLPFDEITIGQYLRTAGIRAALCGKTHHTEDHVWMPALEKAGADCESLYPRHAGLEPWEVNDMIGEGWVAHLKAQGYDLPFDSNPLSAPFAVRSPDGKVLNGWRFEAARYPTVVDAKDSDTAFMTTRAIEFIQDAGDQPWMLHLSYLKPHWPNVAPAPYHEMYNPEQVPPPLRSSSELVDPHPLLQPFREERRSLPLDQETTWREMRATYFGLITQIDDELGRLFRFLESAGQLNDTMIIFTSDHGEYMGDHWLFEKELFYEQAIRVPLIIYDPRREANATRGTVNHQFVESVDILPTCLDAFGLEVPRHVQGGSLIPFLHGQPSSEWRNAIYADWDFRFYHVGEKLELPLDKCRAWMVRDNHYKYIHFNGLPPMLFDLEKDPDEFHNVAGLPEYKNIEYECLRKLIEWRQSTEDNSRAAWLEAVHQRQGVSFVPDDMLELSPAVDA